MKEYLSLFRAAHDGRLKEFQAVFLRELKLLLGNARRVEEVEERELDAIGREVASPDGISLLEGGDDQADILYIPVRTGEDRRRYVVADGNLKSVDLKAVHLLRQIYEARLEISRIAESSVREQVFDPDVGVLTRHALDLLFAQEVARSGLFNTSVGLILLKFREDDLKQSVQRILPVMRRTDYLFKLTDAELVLMVIECTDKSCEATIRRLERELGGHITGAAYTLCPEHGTDLSGLLEEVRHGVR